MLHIIHLWLGGYRLLYESFNMEKYKRREINFEYINKIIIYFREDSETVKKLAEYGNNFEKTAYEYDTMVVDSCETRDGIVHAILKYK